MPEEPDWWSIPWWSEDEIPKPDSADSLRSAKRHYGRSVSEKTGTERQDFEDFGITAWGNEDDEDFEDLNSKPSQDQASPSVQILQSEIIDVVRKLPSDAAFKKLFWELLEFESVDDSVSREILEELPQAFSVPLIRAETDSLKIVAVNVVENYTLSDCTKDIRQLGSKLGKVYQMSLLVVGSVREPGRTIIVLCSGEKPPRIFPIYDDRSVRNISKILVELCPNDSVREGLATYSQLEQAFSDEELDRFFRDWILSQRKLSYWWLFHQVQKSKLLGHDEQIRLFQELDKLWPLIDRGDNLVPNDAKARRLYNILLTRNLRLAAWLARRYDRRIRSGMDYEDLYQEGLMGLIKAIARFDPYRDIQFSTFAYWWVRQSITRSIADQGATIRLPVHVHEKLIKARRLVRTNELTMGRLPEDDELAAEVGWPARRVRHILEVSIPPKRADLTSSTNGGARPWETIADTESRQPPDVVWQNHLQERICYLLCTLPARQERIIRMRFGIGLDTDHTLEEIGQQLSLTRERIRQIEAKALRLLKHPTRARKLRQFLDY